MVYFYSFNKALTQGLQQVILFTSLKDTAIVILVSLYTLFFGFYFGIPLALEISNAAGAVWFSFLIFSGVLLMYKVAQLVWLSIVAISTYLAGLISSLKLKTSFS